MKNTTSETKRIDWMITLVPLLLIVGLCVIFMILPEQAGAVLSQIRFFFGDTFGVYYLIIGLGMLIVSIYIAASKYGNIVLGKPDEKPKYSFFVWGSMMFTAGLAADILFYSFSEWVMYAADPHLAEMLHSGLGRGIPNFPLEPGALGVLPGAGCGIWLYAPCARRQSSEVFRGVPSGAGQAHRRAGRTAH